MQEKVEIRKRLQSEREKLAPEEVKALSRQMCDHFVLWLTARKFSNIFLYQSFRNEPDLTPLLFSVSIPIVMPVVVSQAEMKFYPVSTDTEFRINQWGIKEPVVSGSVEDVRPDKTSLVVLPALAVDSVGHRLGYGGGFYDRFLSEQNTIRMVAVYERFVVERLPYGGHDIQMQYVLSENGIREI